MTLFGKEPAVVIGLFAGAVVALASIFDVVIDEGTLETVLLAVVPVVAGFFTRSQVTPV